MSQPATRARAGRNRTSLYQEITDKIMAELEAGRVPWVQPWGTRAAKASLAMPKNAATNRRYSGINVLILWSAVIERGFTGQSWLTFRQAVRRASRMKGETYGSMSSVQLCRRFPHAPPATVLCEAGMEAQVAFQPSDHGGRGEGRTGESSESSLKRVVRKLVTEMLADTVQLGNAKSGEFGLSVDTAPRRKEDTHPDRDSFMWNTETPLRTADLSAVGQPQGRLNAQREQEDSRSECRLVERPGERITRRIGQYPSRKAADVSLVNRPKSFGTIASCGKS